MTETTYLKAINTALLEAMRDDETVLVLGEDVAEGGPYGATAGLAEEFGPQRVLNTPISEGAVCGVAIGAAQSGLRPVVEVMFIDFITLALDQLAASCRFRSWCAPRAGRGSGAAPSTRRASRRGLPTCRG